MIKNLKMYGRVFTDIGEGGTGIQFRQIQLEGGMKLALFKDPNGGCWNIWESTCYAYIKS
jgi:hypothetical protein